MSGRRSEDAIRLRARPRLVAALALAVLAAASIVPLRIASCGPAPENLWCYTEPFFGEWPLWNLIGGAIVGLVVGCRLGVALVLAANLLGFVAFSLLDPLQSTYPFDLSYEVNFFLFGGIPALVGLTGASLVRTSLGCRGRRALTRPSARLRLPIRMDGRDRPPGAAREERP